MEFDGRRWRAVDLARAVNEKKIDPVDLMRSCQTNQEKHDQLNCFLNSSGEPALEQASLLRTRIQKGEQFQLAGLPIALKDNICTAGLKTTCGSKILSNYVPPYDASAVRMLKVSGAIVAGKTNMDEFGMGSSTENPHFGPSLNPHDHSRSCGGSSGGSAAAVAAGIVPFALGSDTGGSVRQPASFCGIVGFKPTYGAISRYGLVSYASSLEQIGVLAGCVDDAGLLFRSIVGRDSNDATSRLIDENIPSAAKIDPTKLKLGLYLGGADSEGLDPQVESSLGAALDQLRSAGTLVEPVTLDTLRYAVACYYVIACAEASSNLSRYDGIRFGRRSSSVSNLEELYVKSRQEGFGTEVQQRILLGTYVLSSGFYDEYYGAALRTRSLIAQEMSTLLRTYDALILPTVPERAFRIGDKISDPMAMYLSDIFTVPANLAGLPAISIPCEPVDQGLPLGLQIIGASGRDHRLLSMAAALEEFWNPAGTLRVPS